MTSIYEALTGAKKRYQTENPLYAAGLHAINNPLELETNDPIKKGIASALSSVMGGALAGYGKTQGEKTYNEEFLPALLKAQQQVGNQQYANVQELMAPDTGLSLPAIQELLKVSGGESAVAALLGQNESAKAQKLQLVLAAAKEKDPRVKESLFKLAGVKFDEPERISSGAYGGSGFAQASMGGFGGPGFVYDPQRAFEQRQARGMDPGLNEKITEDENEDFRMRSRDLRKELAEEQNAVRTMTDYVSKAAPLIEGAGGTGDIWGWRVLEDAVHGARGTDIYKARKEMNSLASDAIQIAKSKTGTLGAINPKELEILLSAGVGTANTPQTNKNILTVIDAQRKRLVEKSNFMNQMLGRGVDPDMARNMWNNYTAENTIIKTDMESGIVSQVDVPSWQDWLSKKQQPGATGAPQLTPVSNSAPGNDKPAGLPPGAKKDPKTGKWYKYDQVNNKVQVFN